MIPGLTNCSVVTVTCCCGKNRPLLDHTNQETNPDLGRQRMPWEEVLFVTGSKKKNENLDKQTKAKVKIPCELHELETENSSAEMV